jgi:TatD DNase family protein
MGFLVDTHAHLDDERFKDDMESVLRRAEESGVRYIINVGTDISSSKRCLELAESYPQIYATVGVHPHDAKDFGHESIKALRRLATKKKVVSIGETGLDYYRNISPRDAQIRAFQTQITLAEESGLPLIVHQRDAKEDVFEVLQRKKGELRGVFHAFSGDKTLLYRVLSCGFFVSICGAVTFAGSRLPEVIRHIPLDRFLLETDSPYIAPHPKRGRRNEPAFLKYTAKRVSEILRLTLDDVIRINSANSYRLFGVGEMRRGEITYKIRNSLYINLTNRCTNRCVFCGRKNDFMVKGYNLELKHEPTPQEILQEVKDPAIFDEIVFCGFGEPILRLDDLKVISKELKRRGARRIRINTNGHGNLIHGRNILPELKEALVDSISVSLNAETGEKYHRICQPKFGPRTFQGVIDFIREARRRFEDVRVSVVDLPEIDIKACEALCKDLDCTLRIRRYNLVG